MNSKLLKKAGILVGALMGIAAAVGMFTPRAKADSWDKMTLLTLDQPTQVGDTYLDPGTYMFKLANSDRHIVQIFTKDRSHLINTIFAIPSYRVFPTASTEISYWETPPGTARAVREWFYPGDRDGQEFQYPKELRQIAVVTPPAPAPPPTVVEPAPPQAAVEPEPPAPQALEQAPAEQPPVEIAQTAPQEIAQNSPPPAPEPQPPAQAEPPQALPQTASPYPLFGLGGLLALGLYGVLRLKAIA